MSRTFIAVIAAALVGCGGGGEQQAAQDSLQRDLELAPAESTVALNDQPSGEAQPAPAPAPRPSNQPRPTTQPRPSAPAPSAPAPAAPQTRTLASGSSVTAQAVDTLHSRHNKAGETFTATIGNDVKDARCNVVIPAGATVKFKVLVIEPAPDKNAKDGKLQLEAREILIDGKSYPITGLARAGTIEHALEGQGVTAGGAARVGGGAAAGAIAGKVIGGKTGAVVGGVAGAAGGAVLAAKTADRDVVVRPGMAVTFTLSSDFTITR